MSYTELYQVTLDGDVTSHSEYQNAYRGAMLVWDTMAKRYGLSFFTDSQKVWDLYKDIRVSFDLRIVMASTFDNVMVKCENLPRLINAIGTFGHVFGDAGNLELQIEALKELQQSGDCFAVCWNQTSVNANPWQVYDEKIEDYKTYNIFHGDRHWFLFEDDNFGGEGN